MSYEIPLWMKFMPWRWAPRGVRAGFKRALSRWAPRAFHGIEWLLGSWLLPHESTLAMFPDMTPLDGARARAVLGATRISMLHPATLTALWHLAQKSDGAILEVGPYTGGATVILGRAVAAAGRPRPLLCIEVGGDNSSHPTRPSKDILRDLEANLERFGVRELVRVLVGWSYDAAIVAAIRRVAAVDPIGLLILDANGEVGTEIERLAPYCRPGCYVVLDDYVEEGPAPIKAPLVQRDVSRLVDPGRLQPFGVLPHGTWFGRLAG